MEYCSLRDAEQSDMHLLRSELGEGAWRYLSRLLEFFCTKPEWILLGFDRGSLVDALAVAAPSECSLPLEIIRLYGRLDFLKADSFRLFQRAIEKAKFSGARELYFAAPESPAQSSLLHQAGFCRWRTVLRFESADPVGLGLRGYRSAEVGNFARTEIVELIEKTSEHSCDSQIELYRERLGGIADAEMTLRMMESLRSDPRWWRVAKAPEGKAVGIILPVVAFGEPTIGFIGIIPEYRGQKIASFLLAEAWSIMRQQRFSTLSAEADERSLSMHRALTRSEFSLRSRRQEWKLEL